MFDWNDLLATGLSSLIVIPPQTAMRALQTAVAHSMFWVRMDNPDSGVGVAKCIDCVADGIEMLWKVFDRAVRHLT